MSSSCATATAASATTHSSSGEFCRLLTQSLLCESPHSLGTAASFSSSTSTASSASSPTTPPPEDTSSTSGGSPKLWVFSHNPYSFGPRSTLSDGEVSEDECSRSQTESTTPSSKEPSVEDPGLALEVQLRCILVQLSQLPPNISLAPLDLIFQPLAHTKDPHALAKIPQLLFWKALYNADQLDFWAQVAAHFFGWTPAEHRKLVRFEFLRLVTRMELLTLSEELAASEVEESKIRCERLKTIAFCGLLYNYGVLSDVEMRQIIEPMACRMAIVFSVKESVFSLQCIMILLPLIYKRMDSTDATYIDDLVWQVLSVAMEQDPETYQTVSEFIGQREQEKKMNAAHQPTSTVSNGDDSEPEPNLQSSEAGEEDPVMNEAYNPGPHPNSYKYADAYEPQNKGYRNKRGIENDVESYEYRSSWDEFDDY